MADPFDQLAEDLITVSRAAPNLPPGIALASAQSSDPVSTAQASRGFQEAMFLWSRLGQMESWDESSAWGQLSQPQQEMLEQVGYAPPHRRPDNRPAWQKVLSGISGGLKHAGKAVLDAFEWPFEQVSHAYRTAKLLESEEAARRGVLDVPGGRFSIAPWSLTGWSDAWRRAADDTPDFFQPPEFTLSESGITLPDAHKPLLLDIVGGADEFTLYSKYGPALVGEVTADPTFNRARALIESTQISPGRVIAHSLGIRPGQRTQVIPFVGPEVDAFDYVSGLADGLTRWYGDPFNRPMVGLSRGVRNLRSVMHSVQDAQDYARVSRLSGVQRGHRRIAQIFSSTDDPARAVGQIAEEFPSLAQSTSLLSDLGRATPSSPGEVQEFFEGAWASVATMSGRSARYYQAISHAPYLSRLTPVKNAVKRGVIRGFEATESVPVFRRAGIGFRRFVNLVPDRDSIDVFSERGTEYIRQLAKFSLPQREVERVVGAWTISDEAGRATVLAGLIDDVGRRMGSDEIPELKRYLSRIIGGITDDVVNRPYGVDEAGSDVSAMSRPGAGSIHSGIHNHQMAGRWQLPRYREMIRASRSMALYRRIPGISHIPDSLVDHLMDGVWKPLVLLRLGFPIRAGGEEVARAMLENGFIPTIRARLATSAVKRMVRNDAGAALAPTEWKLVEWIANRTANAFAQVQGSLAGDRYFRAAAAIYRRYGPSTAGLPPGVTALHDAGGSTDHPRTLLRGTKEGLDGRPHRVFLRPGRNWRLYRDTDELFSQMWHAELKRHVESRTFRLALDHIDDEEAGVRALSDYLSSDAAGGLRKRARRAKFTSDGRAVGVDATADEALRDWSRVAYRSSRGLVTDPDGLPIRSVVDSLRSGAVPIVDDLATIKIGSRPLAVSGQEMQLLSSSAFHGVVHWGFGYIGRMIDWISREPIFVHEYARALDEVAPMAARLRASGISNADRIADDWADAIAIDRTHQLIDRSEVRSQFSQANRNLFPFWHAQEQFLKRWSKAIMRNPALVRRAQLIMMGLRHSGAVQPDESGEDTLVIPGAMWFYSSIMSQASRIFGVNPKIAVPIHFTGKIRFIAPGIESPRAALLPSPGPLLSLGLGFAKLHVPEFGAIAEEKALLERGANRPLWEQLVPTTIVRLFHVFADHPERDAQIGSAMNQAIAYLDAAGLAPGPDASPDAVAEFQDQVRQWARVILAQRVIFGFASPVAPQLEFTESLAPEYRTLLSGLPIEEAQLEFLRQHPNATAYTVFQTEIPTGVARLQPTGAVGDWLSSHADFISRYGTAASWFAPSAPGKFDFDTWLAEIANDFRVRRDPMDFWREIKIRQASQTYYPSRDNFEAALNAASSPVDREALRLSWDTWQEAFFRINPHFQQFLAEGATRSVQRGQMLDQVRVMLEDDARPRTIDETAVRNLISSYDNLLAYTTTLPQNDIGTNIRRAATASFRQYGSTLTDPVARQMFFSLIEPQLAGR